MAAAAAGRRCGDADGSDDGGCGGRGGGGGDGGGCDGGGAVVGGESRGWAVFMTSSCFTHCPIRPDLLAVWMTPRSS